MTCMERERIFAYIHQMLEPREEDAVRAHLAECTRCREAAEEFRKLDVVLNEWKSTEPSSWFDARVRAAVAVKGETKFSDALHGLRWAPWLAPAALTTLVLLVFVVMRRSPEAPPPVARQQLPRLIHPAPAVSPEVQPRIAAQSKPPSLAQPQPKTPAEEDELSLYQNLSVLEDYDLLANFDVLSELPGGGKKVVN